MDIKGKLATRAQDGQKVVLDNEYGDGYVHDVKGHNILEQILITLKKIEYHLSIASDTELKDQDV
jgi:hypothetical protein